MADVIAMPGAPGVPIVQNRGRGSLPKSIPSMSSYRLKRRRRQAQSRAEMLIALEVLLQAAREGHISGFGYFVKLDDEHRADALGDYRIDPSEAVNIAHRLLDYLSTKRAN